MRLVDFFDAVVMLTWSDWHTEPRSNRYHYATRFAKQLPVLFVQPWSPPDTPLRVEPTEVSGVDIVHCAHAIGDKEVREFRELLAARGIRRPLLWIYNSMHFGRLIDAMPNAFRVYHATEDYLTETAGWNDGMATVAKSVIDTLPSIDFMVFVTEAIVESYYRRGGYDGPSIVIENGCDARFFLDRAPVKLPSERHSRPVAIFQGGINQRLDYSLICDLVERMPDWEFRFCGAAIDSADWQSVLRRPNVRYLGAMSPEEFTKEMYEATVGLIPFIQDQWIRNSLPLKAYEYVACGLPVVTVPITALERAPELFATATTASEFEDAIRRTADTRYDPDLLERRRQAALANSYDVRFERMTAELISTRRALENNKARLRLAVLYDAMTSMHVNTICEHVEAFGKYSRHDVTYIPATAAYWQRSAEEVARMVDLRPFDVVVLHYSVRISILEHLDEGLAQALERYHGFKVLFLQDEYEGVEIARAWMDRLKFDLVYTCVPEDELDKIYPAYRYPATEFLRTLTGYVPEYRNLERYAKPLNERRIVIGYRGRRLPEIYGLLGYEKYRIGVEMKAHAAARGLVVDIEVDDEHRIYGRDWYAFLGSARATLGTESGSNVFDFNGSLKRAIERLRSKATSPLDFEQIHAQVLAPHDGFIRMNQVSPKIFESIRLGTALILFEGEYSGVVEPETHYIPLKKDFSNIDDVLDKVQNDDYIEALTERAYRDIVETGRYSYRNFINEFDAVIDARILRKREHNILNGPLISVESDGSLKTLLPILPGMVTAGRHPLGVPLSLQDLISGTTVPLAVTVDGVTQAHSSFAFRSAQWVWRRLPGGIRNRVLPLGIKVRNWMAHATPKKSFLYRAARRGWHMLPAVTRARLVRLISSVRHRQGT